MKHSLLATFLSLILAATALGAPPQDPPIMVTIHARFEGFDTRYFENGNFSKAYKADGLLSAPSVTTRSGQNASVEIIREIPVPETASGEKNIKSGVRLEVSPIVKNGKITLSGKTIVRRRLAQIDTQPLGAISFATQETFFSGAVQNGKELSIAVGDGPKDKARVTLTAQLIDSKGTPAK